MRPTVSRDLWLGPVGESGGVLVLVYVSTEVAFRRRRCLETVCVARSRLVFGFASMESDEGNDEAVGLHP